MSSAAHVVVGDWVGGEAARVAAGDREGLLANLRSDAWRLHPVAEVAGHDQRLRVCRVERAVGVL